ncbi:MAG: proline dehydrogenase family protein, partial [Sphingorhabdus sp.]
MMQNWDALDADKYQDENATVTALLASAILLPEQQACIQSEAIALIKAVRESSKKSGVVESFLQQFSLGTTEGIALMCLAEALLRVPDAETRNKLIAEKIGSADWSAHIGQSDSMFVNASTWGLLLTGKIVDVDAGIRHNGSGYFKRLIAKVGEPVIREAVGAAVRIMSEQFVLGETINSALKRAKREGTLCSFDMLGEGARTLADAERYTAIYADAIDAVGSNTSEAGPEAGHGISIKLSALSPRFEAVQEHSVWTDLYPRILLLAQRAKKFDLGFTIDAEEADRTVLTLKLLDRLAHEKSLDNWQGLGVVVQAYQKRAPLVISAIEALARESGRRIMVRLVKGAYWDSEIKRAQIAGRPDYPV